MTSVRGHEVVVASNGLHSHTHAKPVLLLGFSACHDMQLARATAPRTEATAAVLFYCVQQLSVHGMQLWVVQHQEQSSVL